LHIQSGRAKVIWRQSGKSNLAPVWNSGQSGAGQQKNFQFVNDQSGKLALGLLVPEGTQSAKTLKDQIANCNMGNLAICTRLQPIWPDCFGSASFTIICR